MGEHGAHPLRRGDRSEALVWSVDDCPPKVVSTGADLDWAAVECEKYANVRVVLVFQSQWSPITCIVIDT